MIRRDFETRTPSGTDIVEKIELGRDDNRDALLRDLALNLFWANRFAITMYDERPIRSGDVSRTRSDVFLPVVEPWADGEGRPGCCERCSGRCSSSVGNASAASNPLAIHDAVRDGLMARPMRICASGSDAGAGRRLRRDADRPVGRGRLGAAQPAPPA